MRQRRDEPDPDQPAVTGPHRRGGWKAERIETQAMTPDEHTRAVTALAALIARWHQHRHDPPYEQDDAA
ncbi:hypothetical protein [Streptomyces phytophilus]|uniref:hypothetical protein n=1 Tax=Streptomyces phytophilus TaxID=722715 RepID=UPI0015F03F37|nr:hypothetical protein [Streptomyces phytophilus]